MTLTIEIEVEGAEQPLMLDVEMTDAGYAQTAILRVPAHEWSAGREFRSFQSVPVNPLAWVSHERICEEYREECRQQRGVYDFRA